MARKRRKNKRFYVLVLAFAMIFAGFYTFFGSNGLMEIMRRKNMEKDLKHKLTRIKNDNIRLHSEIWTLKNKPSEVERIAREKLFLIKPGETVYLIKEE